MLGQIPRIHKLFTSLELFGFVAYNYNIIQYMSCKIEMRRAVLLNVCPLLYAHAEAKLGTFAMEFEYQDNGQPSKRALIEF